MMPMICAKVLRRYFLNYVRKVSGSALATRQAAGKAMMRGMMLQPSYGDKKSKREAQKFGILLSLLPGLLSY